MYILHLILLLLLTGVFVPQQSVQWTEREIVYDLFRLRNEHKADSAELYFADTVQVYMKYLRNVPKRKITQSDKQFWKDHPKNRFEMTAPVQISTKAGITTAIVYGREYLDGTTFQNERIEIRFNRHKKIYYYRGFRVKGAR